MAGKIKVQSDEKPWWVRYYWAWFVLGFVLAFGAFLIFGQGGEKKQESGLNFPDIEDEEIPVLPEEGVLTEEEAFTTTPAENNDEMAPPAVEARKEGVEGVWKVYSQRLFYDEGGAGPWLSASEGTAVTQGLRIKNDGVWEYGSSSGKWSVSSITESDWKAWGINSYGPTRKIVLQDWNGNGKTASGPIEKSTNIDFVWVIYRVEPPTVQKQGIVNMKFGH